MIKAGSIVVASLLLVPFAFSPTAMAVEKPNVLVMGEDADLDTVPRNSRVFKRVLDAVANQLDLEGFDVFDETAVTQGDFVQGRVRRTDAEVLDIARSITRPPIDVVVLFSIYASANELSFTTKIKTRIEGRMINAHTGQRLGSFEVESPNEWNGPKDCPRECLLEVVGKYSRILAQDLGAVLAVKLAALVEVEAPARAAPGAQAVGIGGAYTLIFDGFTADEIIDVEEFFVVFGGYENHRSVYSGARYHEYWYQSDSPSARLERNLNKMLRFLNVKGRITFSGNEFRVQKIAQRRTLRIDPEDFR